MNPKAKQIIMSDRTTRPHQFTGAPPRWHVTIHQILKIQKEKAENERKRIKIPVFSFNQYKIWTNTRTYSIRICSSIPWTKKEAVIPHFTPYFPTISKKNPWHSKPSLRHRHRHHHRQNRKEWPKKKKPLKSPGIYKPYQKPPPPHLQEKVAIVEQPPLSLSPPALGGCWLVGLLGEGVKPGFWDGRKTAVFCSAVGGGGGGCHPFAGGAHG